MEVFRAYFAGFEECYIVIGGTACQEHFESQGLRFRSTRDIDMVLVVEALKDDFISRFWEFIRVGNYRDKQVGEGARQYYRFVNPENEAFPKQIELFSRTPDVITRTDGMTLTPIPTSEQLSSLSAILMDDAYYEFTKTHSIKGSVINRADDLALICLKAKAYLDLYDRKQAGMPVDSTDISKHRNDVFRLAATLRDDQWTDLPSTISHDLQKFVQLMESLKPDLKAILKQMGIATVSSEDLLGQIKHVFKL